MLAFVRSGNVNVNDGKVYYVGERGYGWSRTAKSDTNAYDLYFNTTGVNPSNDYGRWVGRPLRWGLAGCGADLQLDCYSAIVFGFYVGGDF